MIASQHGSNELSTPEKYTALIIHPVLSKTNAQDRPLDIQIEEVEGLVSSINIDLLKTLTVNVQSIKAGYFLGKGNKEKIKDEINELKPDVIIFNSDLSPVQQRNLEKYWKCKVIDRTGLILEIFGERAQTREGKIQVELAALEYQKSRLVRSWTHLERQRGGAGFMGGPGETQIEIDRRIIGDRIVKLKKDLQDVKRTRELARKSRERVPFPVVALVGYTNAGKSTLFNKLTGAEVFVEDMPFATLDPTMRVLELTRSTKVIISDTVGFISDLPTSLIAAFRSTLEQVIYADVILHVMDASNPDIDTHKQDVIKVLHDLGIEYEQDHRIIEVMNKIDLLDKDDYQEILNKTHFQSNLLTISALSGQGTETLLELVQSKLSENKLKVMIQIDVTDGKALAWLYRNAQIIDREDKKRHILLDVEIDPASLGRFHDKFDYKSDIVDHESKKSIYGQ